MIVSAILFFLIVFVFIFLPGYYLYSLTGRKGSGSEEFVLSLGIGIGVYLSLCVILFWIHFFSGILLLVPLSFLGILKLVKQHTITVRSFFTIEFLLILLGSCLMVFYTWNSGMLYHNSLYFYGVNSTDSIYHVSLIQSLLSGFPPYHLAISGVALKGYNFLYDLFVASFVGIFRLPLLDVFFRFSAFFTALFFGLAGWMMTRSLGFSRKASIVTILLLYTLRGLDWYVNFIFLHLFHLPFNSSGIMQSPEQLVDGSVAFSVGILLITIQLLFTEKRSKVLFLVLVVLGALIPTIKIYTGFLYFIGLTWYASYLFLKKKELWGCQILVVSALLAACIYAPLNYGAGKLVFAPFLIYRFYIENAAIFQHLHWNVNLALFESKHNFIHLGYFYFVAGILFLSSAFGIRLISGISMLQKKSWKDSKLAFFFILILAGILMPTLFIQSVAPLVIIQFFWIVNILLILTTMQTLDSLFVKTKTVLVGIGVLLVLFSIPELTQSLRGYITPSLIIHQDTLTIVSLLQKVPQYETTLVLVKPEGEVVPILTALSGHKIYFEKEVMEFANTTSVLALRQTQVSDIANNLLSCHQKDMTQRSLLTLLGINHIRYILISDQMKNCLQGLSYMTISHQSGYELLILTP